MFSFLKTQKASGFSGAKIEGIPDIFDYKK
jgi:hypothetical protein